MGKMSLCGQSLHVKVRSGVCGAVWDTHVHACGVKAVRKEGSLESRVQVASHAFDM